MNKFISTVSLIYFFYLADEEISTTPDPSAPKEPVCVDGWTQWMNSDVPQPGDWVCATFDCMSNFRCYSNNKIKRHEI